MAETPAASLRAGLLVVHSPTSKPEPLQRLAERIIKAADTEIEASTGVHWEFVTPLPRALEESKTHSVADFLSKAMTTMSEGLMDMVIVLTDVPISGQDKTLVYGSHSRTARVAVMSTHRLLQGGDGDADRKLTDAQVVRNASTLFLHLIGHIVGLVHQWRQGDVMASFRYDPRREEPRFTDDERRRLKKKAHKLPDQKVEAAGPLMSFIFHGVSAMRNLGEVMMPVLRGRAFKIPLAMTSMLTAALIPVIVLVFTAEIWDVALHLSWRTTILFAVATVILGALYVVVVQNLFFPRKERETLTEHAAVVNVVVWLCMLEALVGLFVLIFAFVWGIEKYVFPPALMQRWTDLDHPATMLDRVKLAVFVSTLGTLTAALGGGLDRQTVARHLALFSDRA